MCQCVYMWEKGKFLLQGNTKVRKSKNKNAHSSVKMYFNGYNKRWVCPPLLPFARTEPLEHISEDVKEY